jgi:hypothetical protein
MVSSQVIEVDRWSVWELIKQSSYCSFNLVVGRKILLDIMKD